MLDARERAAGGAVAYTMPVEGIFRRDGPKSKRQKVQLTN